MSERERRECIAAYEYVQRLKDAVEIKGRHHDAEVVIAAWEAVKRAAYMAEPDLEGAILTVQAELPAVRTAHCGVCGARYTKREWVAQ